MRIKVGVVGTGYAARSRVEALLSDRRSQPLLTAGHWHTAAFAERYGLQAVESWQQLVNDPRIDLVIVANVSSLHGDVVEAALQAGKPVVVEYPLSLDVLQAKRLVELATDKGLLLHVEHIELLGGLHQAMRKHLPDVGVPTYVNYRTLNPQHPAPLKWTYRQDLFGFPFCGALSRVHRLTNLFGQVERVDCCTQIVSREPDSDNSDYFKGILSSARLQFERGLVAELTYGKGENLWARRRDIEIQGEFGALTFVGNAGTLTTAEAVRTITVAPRKGLFVKDTRMVLDHLTDQAPLYVSAAESVYALTVGDALRRASESGRTVYL
ncbi:MAG: Gfo/Idh/MocA family oxidoreductase [Phormidesmis sp.]